MTHTNLTVEERSFEANERRESQLWWLAVLVIVLMSMALFAVDFSHTEKVRWWLLPKLGIMMDAVLFRGALIIATLLICTYFRETARNLRRRNKQLVHDLSEHTAQLERKTAEVSRLKELSDQLIGITDQQVALDLVLNMAVELISADTASILLRDRNTDTMRIVSACGIPERIVKSAQVRVGESLAGMVAKDGRGMIINSDEVEGELASFSQRTDSIVSSAIVPIQIDGEVRGVVSIAKRRPGGCFTDEDLGVLSTLGNQCSLVIQKAELLTSLESQVEKLAHTVEELERAEAEVKQSEKLASIGQLAGGVAHEIRNPLQVILGRVELIRMRETDQAKIAQFDCIIEYIGRISDILSNLLSFSRQSSGRDYHEIDLTDVVDSTISLLEPQVRPDNINIKVAYEDDVPLVYGNAGQLQQVFTNLALNAYQAMRDQGSGTLTVKVRGVDGEVELDFSDTGPGIPEEHLARLFDPFFTTKPEGEGTGLGLSIAYLIVKEHHGSIQVRSTIGEGSSFLLKFPAADRYLEKDPEAAGRASTARPDDKDSAACAA